MQPHMIENLAKHAGTSSSTQPRGTAGRLRLIAAKFVLAGPASPL